MIGGSEEKLDMEHLNDVLIRIKSYLMERNISHSILYGGGVDSSNVKILKQLSCNDGFIISSSAMDLNELEKIYNELKEGN